jgi:hypothetical protein
MVLCILNVELPAFQHGHGFLGLDGQDEFLDLAGQQPYYIQGKKKHEVLVAALVSRRKRPTFHVRRNWLP